MPRPKASGSERAAHGHAEPDELLGLLLQGEAVLRDRHPQHAARWDDLLEWESTLVDAGAITITPVQQLRDQRVSRRGRSRRARPHASGPR